jgi:hypothetical protein
MAKIQTLTDEELLKRSGYAGSSLTALAILMSLFAVLSVVLTLLTEAAPKPDAARSGVALLPLLSWALPLTSCVVAAGLWLLAVAARRGNAAAPGIVLLVLAVQILFSLAIVSTVLTKGGALMMNLVILAVVLLSAAAVSTTRNVLLEMKKRGVWETKFAAARPSRGLVVCGAILLVVGYLGLNAGRFIPAVLAEQKAKEQANEVEQVKAFVACVKSAEPEAVTALQNWGKIKDAESLKTAISKVEALDRKVASIQYDVTPDSPLASILLKYRRALADWKNGLAVFDSPEPDAEKGKQLLKSGADLRAEAAREFARRYLRH